MPHRDSPSMQWRMSRQRYRLVGSKCGCGALYMPGRALCGECGGKTQNYEFSGDGKIIAHTVIHAAPDGFVNTPYMIALVKLAEGPVISGQVVDDMSGIGVDKKVKSVFRKLRDSGDGIIGYGFKFEVVD